MRLRSGGLYGLRPVLAALSALLAGPSSAMDWRTPWVEPHDASAAAHHSDEYAWRLFVALNWPADAVARGPDRSARLGAEREVVWETWQSAGDIYLAGGSDPGPWAPGDPRRSQPAARRFESGSLRDLRNVRHIVDGIMVPLEDPLADARRLTEIRSNRTAFEFIRDNSLYNIEGQVRAYADGRDLSFPVGAREVKAKWRPITAAERSRYHTVEVRLADGSRRLYGLTGLHLASKDLPHWFWATFEHIDNPTLPDNEGWQLPSRDTFACPRDADCNRAPEGIELENTVWQYYRLRGTLTSYTDASGEPRRLANSELESGMQSSSSCITCHARAALRVIGGEPVRPAIFDTSGSAGGRERRGFIGEPRAEWFAGAAPGEPKFRCVDFVWSLAKAQRQSPRLEQGQ